MHEHIRGSWVTAQQLREIDDDMDLPDHEAALVKKELDRIDARLRELKCKEPNSHRHMVVCGEHFDYGHYSSCKMTRVLKYKLRDELGFKLRQNLNAIRLEW